MISKKNTKKDNNLKSLQFQAGSKEMDYGQMTEVPIDVPPEMQAAYVNTTDVRQT